VNRTSIIVGPQPPNGATGVRGRSGPDPTARTSEDRSLAHSGNRAVFVVRDQWTWSCGHRHRSLRAAVRCLARERDARRQWGPLNTELRVWKSTVAGHERLEVEGVLITSLVASDRAGEEFNSRSDRVRPDPSTAGPSGREETMMSRFKDRIAHVVASDPLAPEEYPPAFKLVREVGHEDSRLVGYIYGVGEYEGEYGPVPTTKVLRENGEKVSFFWTGAVLKSKIGKASPIELGEKVGISFTGTKRTTDGREYPDYKVHWYDRDTASIDVSKYRDANGDGGEFGEEAPF
jgi:hypothetical protein